jgi:co-chaperonin GroES (HSP10)
MSFFDLFTTNDDKEGKVEARTPLNLKVGDIVEYDLVEYQVIGKIVYKEGAYTWYDYHLAVGGDRFWLFAEDDDRLELALFEKLPPEDELYSKFQSETPNSVVKDGEEFSLVEQGEAQITVTGQVGAKTGQQVEYADYDAGDKLLSVEWWGNELEVSQGEKVTESLFKYYPGDTEEVDK